jgi:guanylate kinase
MKKGLLIVLSGPSGAGKGVICKKILELDKDINLSVSCTTRKAREGEVDGQSYFFLSDKEFTEMIGQDGFLEHAEFVNNRYGTPKDHVFDIVNNGKDIILEIEVQGAAMVKDRYPDAVLIFIVPPSMKELKDRLKGRGTETDKQTDRRLRRAIKELELLSSYDYVIRNDEVERAARKALDIISAEKCAVKRNLGLTKLLIKGEKIV